MSDDDKSVSSSRGSSSGKKSFKKKVLSTGIEELRGHYYVYGQADQALRFHATTKAIAEYAAQNMKMGKEMWKLIKEGKETTFNDPEDPGADATPGQIAVYKGLFFEARQDRVNYYDDKFKVFRLIVGQCNHVMRSKVETHPEYKTMEEKSQVVELLKVMGQLVNSVERGQHPAWVRQAQLKKLIMCQQETNESLEKFQERFEAQLEVTEEQWGLLIPYKFKDEQGTKPQEERDQFLACLILNNVDRGRYKPVIDELANAYSLGNNNYPKDIAGVISMLSDRRGNGGGSDKVDELKDGIVTSFTQVGKQKKCFKCGKRGHMSFECKKKNGSEGKTSFGKNENPWKKEESDSDGESSKSSKGGKEGWFKEKKKGVSGFQYAMETGPWSS